MKDRMLVRFEGWDGTNDQYLCTACKAKMVLSSVTRPDYVWHPRYSDIETIRFCPSCGVRFQEFRDGQVARDRRSSIARDVRSRNEDTRYWMAQRCWSLWDLETTGVQWEPCRPIFSTTYRNHPVPQRIIALDALRGQMKEDQEERKDVWVRYRMVRTQNLTVLKVAWETPWVKIRGLEDKNG